MSYVYYIIYKLDLAFDHKMYDLEMCEDLQNL